LVTFWNYAFPQLTPTIAIKFKIMFIYENEFVYSVATSLKIIVHHMHQTSLFFLGVVTPMFMTPMFFEHYFGSNVFNVIVEATAHAI
jgi:hypothetical protein